MKNLAVSLLTVCLSQTYGNKGTNSVPIVRGSKTFTTIGGGTPIKPTWPSQAPTAPMGSKQESKSGK